MKKWYKESYFDRKNWILENFDKLNLNADETILILLIDLCKTSRKAITYEYLTGKLHKTTKEIDKINSDMPRFKKIAHFIIREREFDKTTSLKIRRFVEDNKRA